MNKLERILCYGIIGASGLLNGCTTVSDYVGQEPIAREIPPVKLSRYLDSKDNPSFGQAAPDLTVFDFGDDRSKYVATIDNIRFAYNSRLLDDEKGIVILSDLRLRNLKGQKVQVDVYFYKFDKYPIKDKDGKFCTTSGKVCSRTDLVPDSDNIRYGDWPVPIPDAQLGEGLETGINDIYLVVRVGAEIGGKMILVGQSDYISTSYMNRTKPDSS